MLKRKMTNKQRIKQLVKLHKAINKTKRVKDDWVYCVHTTDLGEPKISVWHYDWAKRDDNNHTDIMSVYVDLRGKLSSADERLTQEQIDEAVKYGQEWLQRE